MSAKTAHRGTRRRCSARETRSVGDRGRRGLAQGEATLGRRRAPAAPAPALRLTAATRVRGLRYVTDEAPGLRRLRTRSGFRYVDARGRPVRRRSVLRRIRALAIPPAWTDVWISPSPDGHLQAVGRDARGRKQYRYHPRWRESRERTKFHRMAAFGALLPRIRRRVAADLARPRLDREKVLAAVVRLLDTTHIRIGNAEYARENNSFGLTTLRRRHVRVRGAELRFRFRGKGGKLRRIRLSDRQIAAIVRRCQELPGQELFRFRDDDGRVRAIGSGDVNRYLREIAGEELTAKDFRTWGASVLAACALAELGVTDSAREARSRIVRAAEAVAERLGNTPAICRASYVHPAVLESYTKGIVVARRKGPLPRRGRSGLGRDEKAVLDLLRTASRALRIARKAAPVPPGQRAPRRSGADRAGAARARSRRRGPRPVRRASPARPTPSRAKPARARGARGR